MPKLIYILTNPTIPDLVKIGRTSDLEQRMKDLSSGTAVPVPFECYYCCEVKNSRDVEKALHFGLGDHRINPKREFFRIQPERVKALLEALAIHDVTPDRDIVESQEEQDSLDKERARRPVFTFSMVNIEVGSQLTFLKDETKVATVLTDRKIEFEGRECYLTQVAKELLNKKFGVRGPDFWVFNGETLTERRIRLENENVDD